MDTEKVQKIGKTGFTFTKPYVFGVETSKSPLSEKHQHAFELMESLSKLRMGDKICDFTVKVHDQTFAVHRSVIAACSDYFQAMLTHDTKELQEGSVDMKDIEPSAVKQCLDYMYTGEVTVNINNVGALLHAASLMQLKRLLKLCFKYLRKNLNVDNCLDFMNYGQIYSDKELCEVAEKFIVQYFSLVVETKAFLQLKKEDVVRYAVAANLDEISWKAAKTWILHDIDERQPHIEELLSLLKFDTFPSSLIEEISGCDLIKKSQPCKQLLLDGLFSDTKKLKANINTDNCYVLRDLLQTDERENSDDNCEVIITFMADHFEKVAKDERFVKLCEDDVSDILSDLDTRCIDHGVKWRAILEWTKYTEERNALLPDYLTCMKLENMHPELVEVIRSEPLVQKSLECNKILLDAFCPKLECKSIAVSANSPGSIQSLTPSGKIWTTIEGPNNQRTQKIVSLFGDLYLLDSNILLHYTREKAWKKQAILHHIPEDTAKVVSFGDKIYLVEQNVTSHWSADEEKWTEDLPGCKLGKGFCVAASDSHVYAIGGNWTVAKVVQFNPTRKKWTEVTSVKHGRHDAAAVYYKDKVYVMGGNGNKVECYDTLTNEWTDMSSMHENRSRLGACVMGDKIVAMFGSGSATCEVYDLQWDTWSVFDSSKTCVSNSEKTFTACIYDAYLDPTGKKTESYNSFTRCGVRVKRKK